MEGKGQEAIPGVGDSHGDGRSLFLSLWTVDTYSQKVNPYLVIFFQALFSMYRGGTGKAPEYCLSRGCMESGRQSQEGKALFD